MKLQLGTDLYSYPITPLVTKVTGCTTNNADGSTSNCLTQGGFKITLQGDYFIKFPSVFVGGRDCANAAASTVPGLETKQVTCDLPPGTGVNQAVLVKQGDYFSRAVQLVNYGIPTLTAVTGCPVSGSKDCPRSGNTKITITGTVSQLCLPSPCADLILTL